MILRAAAYVLLSIAALLFGAAAFWLCRMIAVGGSVSTAFRMAISLGWSAVGFLAMTIGGSAFLVVLAVSLFRHVHEEE